MMKNKILNFFFYNFFNNIIKICIKKNNNKKINIYIIKYIQKNKINKNIFLINCWVLLSK